MNPDRTDFIHLLGTLLAAETGKAQLQRVEGHLSVLALLQALGVPHPSRTWSKLQRQRLEGFPQHTRKQFRMRDGRKGRFSPAIRVEDAVTLVGFLQQFQHPDTVDVLKQHHRAQVLELLTDSFDDLHPQKQVEQFGVLFDLYFPTHPLGVRVMPGEFAGMGAFQIQRLPGCTVLLVHPDQVGFRPGRVICQLRQWLS